MDVYIYQAELYCVDCGEAIKARLDAEGKTPEDPDDETTFDSHDYPKGPYPDGGGESDTPHHCGNADKCLNAMTLGDGNVKVGVWLENPLTTAGAKHVQEAIDIMGETGEDNAVVNFWAHKYADELENLR